MFEILLQMPPTSSGMFWSLAPDFSATDRLMKDLRIGPYAFLRGWTLSRLWEEYRLYIFAGLLLVVGLLIHVRRTEILVERRTRELKDAFLREEALKAQTQEAEARLEQFQRAQLRGRFLIFLRTRLSSRYTLYLASATDYFDHLIQAAALPI